MSLLLTVFYTSAIHGPVKKGAAKSTSRLFR